MAHPQSPTPVVISVAPNGARRTKKDHPHIPLTADEIAQEAARCHQAGASVIHLHVRKDDASHTLSVQKYRQAIKAIRNQLGDDIIIQATTEACGIYTPEQQIEMVTELKPEATSIAVRELIPTAAEENQAKEFLEWALNENIYPQYILYSEDDVLRFQQLKEKGIIPGARHCLLFVLGRYSVGQISSPKDLIPYFSALHKTGLHETCQWFACAFGKQENACMLTAALTGGNVRIGFENNMHLANGSIAQNNAELVSQFVDSLPVAHRSVATADEARELFLLK